MLVEKFSAELAEQLLYQVDPGRTSFIVFNTHATATVYIHQSKGQGLNGFPIKPGGSFSTKVPEDDPTGEVWITSDTASTDIRHYAGYGYLDERWFKPR